MLSEILELVDVRRQQARHIIDVLCKSCINQVFSRNLTGCKTVLYHLILFYNTIFEVLEINNFGCHSVYVFEHDLYQPKQAFFGMWTNCIGLFSVYNVCVSLK